MKDSALVGMLAALISFSILFNRDAIVRVYNNRKVIIDRVRYSTNEERYFFGFSLFIVALGFWMATIE